MDNEVAYIQEIYTDKYGTLIHAIMIDVMLDKESNGIHGNNIRSAVNPNTTILLERRYLNKEMKLIRKEKVNKNEQ